MFFLMFFEVSCIVSVFCWWYIIFVGVVCVLIVGIGVGCYGGFSDVVGCVGLDCVYMSIILVVYVVLEFGWSVVIFVFNVFEQGWGVQVIILYGVLVDQLCGVVDGKLVDLVNFLVELDIVCLVKVGKVDKDWDVDVIKGILFGLVVMFVVCVGNLKNIRDWDDLLCLGIEVIMFSLLSLGFVKWNLLVFYVVKSDGGWNN